MAISQPIQPQEKPHALGYTFPAEWEKRAGTMMIFPAEHSYGKDTEALRREFAQLAKAIAANEPVEVFCLAKELQDCQALLGATPNLTIHPGDYPIDWARDNAPMLVRNEAGELAVAGFRFNGWGKKYRGWQHDVDTRDTIAQDMGWPIFHSDLVLEGGAIEIAGGTGIVTESAVLNPNRTDWPKAQVEAELKAMLGLDRIIWVNSGLMPDPITDGHVDGLLKFVAEDTVLLHTTADKSDINYSICQEAKAVLESNGLSVVEVPLTNDIVHMNFYIGSGGDIAYVPVCGDPLQDDPALAIIGRYFETVIPIQATAIGDAGGGVHCYTMQIPR
ncbi:MAG: agmatine deiminase family protein [Verrucomicrobiota bacterium]